MPLSHGDPVMRDTMRSRAGEKEGSTVREDMMFVGEEWKKEEFACGCRDESKR